MVESRGKGTMVEEEGIEDILIKEDRWGGLWDEVGSSRLVVGLLVQSRSARGGWGEGGEIPWCLYM